MKSSDFRTIQQHKSSVGFRRKPSEIESNINRCRFIHVTSEETMATSKPTAEQIMANAYRSFSNESRP